MPNRFRLKRSSTASAAPVAGDLLVAELGLNLADKILHTKTVAGDIVELYDDRLKTSDIDDESEAADKLWSAEKIIEELASAGGGGGVVVLDDDTTDFDAGNGDYQVVKFTSGTKDVFTFTGFTATVRSMVLELEVLDAPNLRWYNVDNWYSELEIGGNGPPVVGGDGFGRVVEKLRVKVDSQDEGVTVNATLLGRVLYDPAFRLLIDTNVTGVTGSTSFRIPTSGSGYDCTVDWGDGAVTTHSGSYPTIEHDYGTGNEGRYIVRVTGTFPRIRFNNGGDRQKVEQLMAWGEIAWTSMADAFYGCQFMIITASDAPDLSGVTSMSNFLRGAALANPDTTDWDMSGIASMSFAFEGSGFTGTGMPGWDVSGFTTLSSTFAGCPFSAALDLSGWDVSGLTGSALNNTFLDSDFAGDVSGWDVTGVTQFIQTFRNTPFDGTGVDTWDIASATAMPAFATSCTFSTVNYDAILIAWAADRFSYANDLSLDFGSSKYSTGAAATARANLISYGWTITDGGQV